MSYTLRFSSDSQKDYIRLDNSQKIQIRKSLVKIENYGMQIGQQLSGKLSDCKKIKHKRLGLRIVFKESDLGIEIIEIIVIGKRSDSEVYKIAEKRLGR